jgi:epoxyqueuosine reductase QueG
MNDINSIARLLADFISGNPLNKVPELSDMVIFQEPLVGIASANDPLFIKLKHKEVVGPHHMTPTEWLPKAKTVISYFLPFSLRVRQSNHANDGLPSTEWLYGRIEGESFNNAMRKFLTEEIIKSGGKAIAPLHDPRYKVTDRRSNWSERHVAYIAGLGTFNLGKSFITKKGCAGRFGSVITDLSLSPTVRPYQDIYEYCNNCGACIKRCPVFAISKNGKDHSPCADFVNAMKKKFEPRYGCGKCQTSVPCETRIPS